MTQRFLMVMLAGALTLSPARLPAQTGTHLGLAAGIALPTGTLGDIADAGYNLAAGLSFGAPLIPVGLRLEGGYDSFSLKGAVGSGSARVLSGTANAVLALGPTGASPYLIGGVGLYQSHVSTTAGSGDRTVGGVNIGGGIRFPLGVLSTFIEARYHRMLGNRADNSDWTFIPVTFGVSF